MRISKPPDFRFLMAGYLAYHPETVRAQSSKAQ